MHLWQRNKITKNRVIMARFFMEGGNHENLPFDRLRASLSSTYLDLIGYRKAVVQALRTIGEEVGNMEAYGARPVDSTTACLNEVGEATCPNETHRRK